MLASFFLMLSVVFFLVLLVLAVAVRDQSGTVSSVPSSTQQDLSALENTPAPRKWHQFHRRRPYHPAYPPHYYDDADACLGASGCVALTGSAFGLGMLAGHR